MTTKIPYNHTREDSPITPCPICAAMGAQNGNPHVMRARRDTIAPPIIDSYDVNMPTMNETTRVRCDTPLERPSPLLPFIRSNEEAIRSNAELAKQVGRMFRTLIISVVLWTAAIAVTIIGWMA